MNVPKIESKRELYYLKYKKSSIFNSFKDNNDRNKDSKVTDKITNKRYDKIFEPKMDYITSRQRYIKNLYKNDNIDLKISSKKYHSKIKRIKSRSNSKTNIINSNILFHSLNENKINIKRNMTFYKDNSNNNRKSPALIRKKNNRKLRTIYSRNNDSIIINNILTNSQIIKDASIISNKERNINEGNKTQDNINYNKIRPIKFDMKKIKNSKNYLENEFKLKNNNIKCEREKEELLKRKVKEKAFNRKNFIKDENNKNELLPPIYKFKQKIKNKKTNLNNLESVNYNIINNKSSKMREEYTNLSSIKPSFEKVTSFEIKIPNDNKTNGIKIKNILHSEGLHFFNFSEEADIISGNKGKYIFKIRNSYNDKSFKDKIRKINSKFKKLNVKLNKTDRNYSKKKSELFHDIPKLTDTSKNKKNKK